MSIRRSHSILFNVHCFYSFGQLWLIYSLICETERTTAAAAVCAAQRESLDSSKANYVKDKIENECREEARGERKSFKRVH